MKLAHKEGIFFGSGITAIHYGEYREGFKDINGKPQRRRYTLCGRYAHIDYEDWTKSSQKVTCKKCLKIKERRDLNEITKTHQT